MERLTDIELVGINVQETQARAYGVVGEKMIGDEFVNTSFGRVHIAVQGTKGKPALITCHDIGQNYLSCFGGFFSFRDMEPMLQNFCIYHVDALGQEENAEQLPDNFVYPTVDQLAEILFTVTEHFQIKRFIGFGVGAGASVLCRYAITYPQKMDGLILINGVAGQAGWIEWTYQKISAWYLKGKSMTEFTQDYLLWHHFGKETLELNHDLIMAFKENLQRQNPFNLSFFINAWVNRTDLHIYRLTDAEKKKNPIPIPARSIKCPVLLITGVTSPHVDDTVDLNSRLEPSLANWMKLSDCGGMILEEQPGKVCEALILFLQGMGYVHHVGHVKPAGLTTPSKRPFLEDSNKQVIA